MNETDFLVRIEKVDQELAEDGIPIHARSFRAFEKLAPDYQGPLLGFGVDPDAYPPYVGPNLLKRISEWYEKRYLDRFNTPTDRGKVPVIIRGEIYLIRIPLVFGKCNINILRLIKGLSDDFAKALTQEELDYIRTAFELGFAVIYEIEDLRPRLLEESTTSLSNQSRELLNRAIDDRDTCIKCLSDSPDTNGACFHAQQHAEKMLKAFLLYRNICTEAELRRRPYVHDIESIFSKCSEDASLFHSLTPDIGLLKNISMDIRYKVPAVPADAAVETVWSALRVGGFCASYISGHGGRSKLR